MIEIGSHGIDRRLILKADHPAVIFTPKTEGCSGKAFLAMFSWLEAIGVARWPCVQIGIAVWRGEFAKVDSRAGFRPRPQFCTGNAIGAAYFKGKTEACSDKVFSCCRLRTVERFESQQRDTYFFLVHAFSSPAIPKASTAVGDF